MSEELDFLRKTQHDRSVRGDSIHEGLTVKRKPRVYIAGPFSSNPTHNTHAAIEFMVWCMQNGFAPYCPHLSALTDMVCPQDYEAWMDLDLEWIPACDTLFRLPGVSSGADRECAKAGACGIPIFVAKLDLIDWRGQEWYGR